MDDLTPNNETQIPSAGIEMKKSKTKKTWIALFLAVCLSALGLSSFTMDASAASKISISSLKLSANNKNVTKKTLGMAVNEKTSITVTTKPTTASKNATFKSSDSSVVSVSKKGVITARKAGAANITITISGSKYKTKSTWVTVYVSSKATANPENTALQIKEQGIFSAGGTVITADGTFDPKNHFEETGAGQTSHVDHANVLYQIPENETGLPMVFLHGYGQSRMGWMTTPDGREGWSNMFLKKGHSVFLIDEPRRGEAGQTSVSGTISTKPLDQRWYTQFRIGKWKIKSK